MIIVALWDVLLFVPNALLDMISPIDFVIPSGVFSFFHDFVITLGYVFPLGGLLPIVIASGVLEASKIAMAIIVRLKSFIPTMGS